MKQFRIKCLYLQGDVMKKKGNTMNKFSIIIPIYNMEKLLERCLKSVQLQTYSNFEVIMVNDGSKDGSEQIAASYTYSDKRFRLYTIENGGVSNARNVGISYAQGDYICFIDSDDYIEPEMLECLNSKLQKNIYQLAIIGTQHVVENEIQRTQIYVDYGEEFSQKDYLSHIYDVDGYCGYVWNKVFRTDIIKQHNIQFPKEILICEDLVFCVEYGKYVELVCNVVKPLYNYVAHEDSVTHRLRYEAIKSREKALLILMEYCENLICSQYEEFVLQTRKYCTMLFLMNIYVGDFRNSIYDPERIRECVKRVEDLHVLKKSTPKLCIYYCLLKFCPRFAYLLYRFLKRMQ